MKTPAFNLKLRSDPRYESDLSLLSMVVDCIVGRLSYKSRFGADHFSFDDIREAFLLFRQTADELALSEGWAAVYKKLETIGSEPAILAMRSLRWAMNNRGL